jgi:ankyrin repeat protein
VYGTALQAAAGVGPLKIVELLLEANADVYLEVGYFGTALQAALDRGHRKVVRRLQLAGPAFQHF